MGCEPPPGAAGGDARVRPSVAGESGARQPTAPPRWQPAGNPGHPPHRSAGRRLPNGDASEPPQAAGAPAPVPPRPRGAGVHSRRLAGPRPGQARTGQCGESWPFCGRLLPGGPRRKDAERAGSRRIEQQSRVQRARTGRAEGHRHRQPIDRGACGSPIRLARRAVSLSRPPLMRRSTDVLQRTSQRCGHTASARIRGKHPASGVGQ